MLPFHAIPICPHIFVSFGSATRALRFPRGSAYGDLEMPTPRFLEPGKGPLSQSQKIKIDKRHDVVPGHSGGLPERAGMAHLPFCQLEVVCEKLSRTGLNFQVFSTVLVVLLLVINISLCLSSCVTFDQAAEELEEKYGISATVADARQELKGARFDAFVECCSTEILSHHLGWVKPLDKKLVGWLASDHRAVITIEEQAKFQMDCSGRRSGLSFVNVSSVYPLLVAQGERYWRFCIASAAGCQVDQVWL